MSNARTFGVCGAGTMGSGIAYAAAAAGYDVWLYDISETMLERGRASVSSFLASGLERGKITQQDADAIGACVRTTSRIEDFADCSVVVEAILESLDAKQDLFRRLEAVVDASTVLASNTSSLPITAIAAALERPERCVGIHFFNPAHIMRLVEVIEGFRTSSETMDRSIALSRELGKTPVRAADTPGFIVNRVARNFYGESFRIVGEGAATHDQVDRCMRGIGFKMGPFELMDLIGIDVNLMVTRSVYDLYFDEPRFRPHLIQQKMVESGRLGRKSGGGFY